MDFLNNFDGSFVNTDPFLLFFGAFYTILGLSILTSKKEWLDFIDLFINNRSMSIVLGVFTLPIALFIVVFYNNWDTPGSTILMITGSTILMITGYLGLIKSLLLFLCPAHLQNFLNKGFIQKYLWVDGVSGILLGVGMLIL